MSKRKLRTDDKFRTHEKIRKKIRRTLPQAAERIKKIECKSKQKLRTKKKFRNDRVHTGPGNREKVGDFEQAFSRPGIAGKFGILRDWSGNRREF